MKWRKLGRIFQPENNQTWMRSHASNPVAEHRSGDVFRVYFGARDERNRTSIGWLEIDLRHPARVLRLAAQPVVAPGTAGAFDDSGASMGCLVAAAGGARYLYYVGWNLGVTVPWRNSIGLAISAGDDAPFEKYSPAPVLDRSRSDPYSVSYPSVLRDGAAWRMWYGSDLNSGAKREDVLHVIKHAESGDGRQWTPGQGIALDIRPGAELALARPCVLKDKGRYRMWYSYRGAAYRIGYAESADGGTTWTRDDARAGIGVSDSGWDSEAVAYPSVFDHGGARYMLYNGNGYGKTGFGLAVLEAD
jgi:hypothetical protein